MSDGGAPYAGDSGRTPRVLIVDDIEENRRLLAVLCAQFGLLAECVAGGREAVEAAASRRFDLILMDVFMPGMDGLEATRRIRALSGGAADAPIIAVTTGAEPGACVRYLASGMCQVVAKPVVPSRLAEAVSAALGAPVQQRRAPRRRRRALAA